MNENAGSSSKNQIQSVFNFIDGGLYDARDIARERTAISVDVDNPQSPYFRAVI